MIKSVSSTNSRGETLLLDLVTSGDDHGIKVFSMEGLGSPKSNVNTIGGSGFRGKKLNSASADQRNIVLTLAIPGTDEDCSDAEKKLYKYFSTSSNITFGVISDTREMVIDAVVETNEFMMFTNVSENSRVSLICPDPYFVGIQEHVVRFSGTTPLFTYPFNNNSITKKLLIFGSELTHVNRDIKYYGDVDTGLTVNVNITGPVSGNITIYNTDYDERTIIDTSAIEGVIGSPLELGDIITLNTRVGSKSLYVERAGIPHNVFNAKHLDSEWIRLYPGVNPITYFADVGIDNVELELSYHELFEGVVS